MERIDTKSFAPKDAKLIKENEGSTPYDLLQLGLSQKAYDRLVAGDYTKLPDNINPETGIGEGGINGEKNGDNPEGISDFLLNIHKSNFEKAGDNLEGIANENQGGEANAGIDDKSAIQMVGDMLDKIKSAGASNTGPLQPTSVEQVAPLTQQPAKPQLSQRKSSNAVADKGTVTVRNIESGNTFSTTRYFANLQMRDGKHEIVE